MSESEPTVYEAQALEVLEVLIDSDCPPGLAAHQLARAIVNLVHDQGGMNAVRITEQIDNIAACMGRPRER
ncbi:MAG: hypothetical protein WC565_07450 [Parcubacteria group bacterium]|jgi:hypothetical protein